MKNRQSSKDRFKMSMALLSERISRSVLTWATLLSTGYIRSHYTETKRSRENGGTNYYSPREIPSGRYQRFRYVLRGCRHGRDRPNVPILAENISNSFFNNTIQTSEKK